MQNEQIKTSWYKEVICTEPFPSVRVPCSNFLENKCSDIKLVKIADGNKRFLDGKDEWLIVPISSSDNINNNNVYIT